jgi:hypothetical protein
MGIAINRWHRIPPARSIENLLPLILPQQVAEKPPVHSSRASGRTVKELKMIEAFSVHAELVEAFRSPFQQPAKFIPNGCLNSVY